MKYLLRRAVRHSLRRENYLMERRIQMSGGTVQPYQSIEQLLAGDTDAVLRIWIDDDGYYFGEIEVGNTILFDVDSQFTIEEVLLELDNYAEDYLLEIKCEAEIARDEAAHLAQIEAAHLAQIEGLDSPEGMRYLEGRESERDYEGPPF